MTRSPSAEPPSAEPPSAAPTSAAPTSVASEGPSATPPAGLPGGWLMFSRFNESNHAFLSTHLVHPDGTGEVELRLPGPEGGGRWSHDGSRIAVMTILEDERVGTAIIKPDGTVDRVLDIPDPTLNLVCTVWSPDDLRLACEGFDDAEPARSGIYTVAVADGGDLQRVTEPEGLHDLPCDFSPDGGQLLFLRTDDESGPLMVVPAAGGEPQPLGSASYGSCRFSPDGQQILASGGGQLVFLDLEGTAVDTIADNEAFLFGAVWSPDGAWIAYSRTAGGFIADVFISRADGSDIWQVTRTAANEITVEWGVEPS